MDRTIKRLELAKTGQFGVYGGGIDFHYTQEYSYSPVTSYVTN